MRCRSKRLEATREGRAIGVCAVNSLSSQVWEHRARSGDVLKLYEVHGVAVWKMRSVQGRRVNLLAAELGTARSWDPIKPSVLAPKTNFEETNDQITKWPNTPSFSGTAHTQCPSEVEESSSREGPLPITEVEAPGSPRTIFRGAPVPTRQPNTPFDVACQRRVVNPLQLANLGQLPVVVAT
jgi:hypothetical protein